MDQQLLSYLFSTNTFQNDGLPVSNKLESELFFGITYLLGAENEANSIIERLKAILTNDLKYNVCVINVSEIIKSNNTFGAPCNYDKDLMFVAQKICDKYKNSAALMCGVIDRIIDNRHKHSNYRNAYIINAVKRPEELNLLKKIYREAFFLIGLYKREPERKEKIAKDISNINDNDIIELMREDEKSSNKEYGTNSKDVYHQADALIDVSSGSWKYPLDSPCNLSTQILNRLINLIFGNPYFTPTFHEHAMFMAFSNSIHSSDLSRQVGAALCMDKQIIALGANECHQAGGLPYFTNENYLDSRQGKDYTRGCDSNAHMIQYVIDNVVNKYKELSKDNDDKINVDILNEALNQSELRSVTEYGRIIHAEMDAITNCARRGIPTNGAILYCTTFPCHNCAKHIVAAGIRHIYFVEPYPKSKALDLFGDSIVYHYEQRKDDNRVILEPYIGITARRYHDFFTMKPRFGNDLMRKNKSTGNTIPFVLSQNSHPRFIVPWLEYDQMEQAVSEFWKTSL